MSDDALRDDVNRLDANVDGLRSILVDVREEVETLRAERDDLRERVAELERVVNPDPGADEYGDLSRSQKVFRLRRSLVEKAARSNGYAMMTYAEVRATFDYQPSVGHAYDLMELAAEADGFGYDTDADENRVTVETDAVNDEALVHGVNNDDRSATA